MEDFFMKNLTILGFFMDKKSLKRVILPLNDKAKWFNVEKASKINKGLLAPLD